MNPCSWLTVLLVLCLALATRTHGLEELEEHFDLVAEIAAQIQLEHTSYTSLAIRIGIRELHSL